MTQLQSVHPTETREITRLDVWLWTRVMIAAAAVVSASPFLVAYASR